jgi:hypothetical protein
LRIGFSLFGVYNTDHLLTTAFAGNPAMPDRAVSAMSLQDSNNGGLCARAGLQWDVIRELSLGITFVSPIMVVVESNNESGSVFTPASMAGGDALQQFNKDKDTHATFGLTGTPQVRLGAAYIYSRGHVELDNTLNFPLKDSTFDYDRKFSWNLRAGMQHKITDTFGFGVGAFTDRSPHQQRGLDFYGITGGISFTKVFELSKGGALNMMSSLNGRYAFGYGTATGTRVPALDDAVGGLTFDSVSSKAWVNEVGLSLGAGLRY